MPQQLDGRYEIIKPLGSGGFGKTFLARDLRIPGSPHCVVKQLYCISQKSEDKALARELFQREAESLAKLGHHDQIPRLLAYFTENDEFYLVEEFIDGRSLESEIKPGQPWPEASVIQLIHNVLEVLSFVHQQGVIHRDIKPENLIRRHSDGKIVLIDFGAIKQIEQAQAHHRTGTQIGTVGYMPPEQAQGKPRPNSDIYGLGIIAISALTGHPATGLPDDPQSGEVVWQHLAPVSPSLAQILSRMVRYYFQHRYQSVAEVQQDMQAIAAQPPLPEQARPPASPKASRSQTTESMATQVVSPQNSRPLQAPSPRPQAKSAPAPRPKKPRRAPWLLGIGLAIFIPVLGGGASLLYNSRASLVNLIESEPPESDQPCTATVVGNIRSERTAYRGNGNILQTGQGQAFEVGTQETRGGWIQIKLPNRQIAWTHLDVVSNEDSLKACLREKNIALTQIADIPPPPRPQPVEPPRPPAPPRPSQDTPDTEETTVIEEENPQETTTEENIPDAENADQSSEPTTTPNSSTDETTPSQTENEATPAPEIIIEESQPAEETAPISPSPPRPEAQENRPTNPPASSNNSPNLSEILGDS